MRPDGNSAKRVIDTSVPPWKRWKTRSRHGRAIRFMETYCRPPKGTGHGQPIKLGTFQKEFVEAALADGIDAAVMQMPRGNGKSSLGGALAVWAVFDEDETGQPQVPIIATTISQAVRSCYGVAVSMIRTEPELARRCLIYTGIATPRVTVPYLGGELFPVSNDPDGLYGLDPSFGLVDEIGFEPITSWEALRQAQGKRERSLIIGLGTPGLDRDNALFHVRTLVKEGAVIPGLVFREYSAGPAADIDDPRVWRAANPAIDAGFLRLSALETDRAMAPEGHFRIFRLGQWVDGTDSWLGPDGRKLWDDLASPARPLADAPTWCGVDVGLKRDSTAVVMVQRRPDGHLHAWAKLWVPTRDAPVDVTDVMKYLRGLHETYRLQGVSYDARFFDVPAKVLDDEGLPMIEVPQSPERMTPVCGSLLELIKRGEIHHDGDPALAEHVLNAVPRFNERGFTLQKSKSRGRIDACIALALATDQALRGEGASEYEERGLIAV